MGTYFHVSRSQDFTPGNIIECKRFDMSSHPDLRGAYENLFPNGLSRHGEHYLFERTINPSHHPNANTAIEALVEWVRRAEFSGLPSRFTSVFGTESLELAKEYRQKWRNNQGHIWQVECEDAYKFDMQLLETGRCLLSAMQSARDYWSQKQSPNPFFEIIMVPPVRIIEEVTNII